MLKRLAVAATCLSLFALTACGNEADSTEPADEKSAAASDVKTVECDYPADGTDPAKEGTEAPTSDAPAEGTTNVVIRTNAGEIGATLDPAKTPCTVHNFVSLIDQGWFDGTQCHRLTTEGIYVLQCGDPTATGTGGPGYTIPDEVDGSETYPAGTLAMAKTSMPDSGGSQFFMVYDETPLPAEYTVFGQIDEAGLEVLKGIGANGTDSGMGDGAPKDEVTIESVTIG